MYNKLIIALTTLVILTAANASPAKAEEDIDNNIYYSVYKPIVFYNSNIVDNKEIFESKYKPEDFYGEWIVTGLIHYICTKATKEKKLWYNDNKGVFKIESDEEEGVQKTFMSTEPLFYRSISFVLGKNSYSGSSSYAGSNTTDGVIIKTYLYKNYFNKGIESSCGEQNVLTISYKIKENRDLKKTDEFIIINKNKILQGIELGYYMILEKKETIKKDRKKLDIYLYDTDTFKPYDEISNFAVLLGEDRTTFYTFKPRRKWQAGENITEVLK